MPAGPTQPVLISVVIPVHNSSDSLSRCLQAVLASDYSHYEVIVVDDGSADASQTTASHFPVRVLHLPGGPFGPAYARNRGAEAAHGEILFFADADVLLRPDTLTNVAETFATHPEVDALFGSYDDSPEAAGFLSRYKNLFHHFIHQQASQDATTFWSACGAIRREVFFKVGGYDEARYARPCIEDIELGYRLNAFGHKIWLNKEIQVKHLKRWTLWSMIKSDVFDRGIPWTLLILRDRHLPNDLNLRLSQRLSALLLCAVLLYLGLAAFSHNLLFLPLLTGLLLILGGSWTGDAPHFRLSRLASVLVYLSIGAIAVLALHFGMVQMLLPLALLVFGIVVDRLRPQPGAFWSRVVFHSVVLGLAAGLVLLLMSLPIRLVVALLLGLFLMVLLNYQFYGYFARKQGVKFALAAIPFHWFYYLYSVFAFSMGAAFHAWNMGRGYFQSLIRRASVSRKAS